MATTSTRSVTRCSWAEGHELLATYHDEEWGVPIHDDTQWFEKLVLDGAQAGLSWLTILKKRDAYRDAFFGFDVVRVAKMTDRDVERLMNNAGIVRNRAKLKSAIGNARAFRVIQDQHGSFDSYLWAFVEGQPVQGEVRTTADWIAHSPLSDSISKDLKKHGFSFVGTTIVYAFLQAGGVINDHMATCHRRLPVRKLARVPT